MADAYRGLTIQFRGDTTDLSRRLSSLRRDSSEVERELRAIDRALELDPGNVELLGQRARYSSEQANILRERLDLVNAALASGEVERGSQAYDRLQREVATTSKRLTDAEAATRDAFDAFRRAASGADEMAGSLGDVSSAASDSADGADEAAGRFSGAFETIKNGALAAVGMRGIGAVTDAARAAGEAAVEMANDYDAAFARIDAACGGAVEDADRLKEVGRDLYTEGWGDSLDSLSEGLVSAREILGDVTDADFSYVTEGAMALEQTFGSDFSETLRGVRVLMDKFGLSGREAMDLVTAGTQRGLDYTNELGDNLSEYAGRWGDAGTSASKYFSLLQAGADNGAYSLDKVGDYLNEFLTSLTDGRMEEAIGDFSSGTQEVFEEFKRGGATAEDVLNAVVGELADMPDEYEKARRASELWSSLGEDNAMSMIESLADVEDSYGDVAGAAGDCADAISDTAANKAESALRRLGDALSPLADLGAEAFSGIVGGLTAIPDHMREVAEHEELVASATRDMDAVMAEAAEGAAELGASAEGSLLGMAEAAYAGREALQAVADLKDGAADAFSSIGGDSAALSAYVDEIDRLRDRSGLTAYEQDRLREAVERYNEITGASVEVTDASNGKLDASTEELRDNAEAWRENAEAQAYASLAAEALETQARAAYELESAQTALAEAQERYNDALTTVTDLSGRVNSGIATDEEHERYVRALEDLDALGAQMGELEGSVSDASVALDEATEAVGYFDEKAAVSAQHLGDEMSSALESLPDGVRASMAAAAGALQDGIEAGTISASEATRLLTETLGAEVAALPEPYRQAGADAAAELARAVADGSVTAEQAEQVLHAALTGDLSGLPEELAGLGSGAVGALAASLDPSDPYAAAVLVRSACAGELSGLEGDAAEAGGRAVSQLASAIGAGDITVDQAAQVIRAAVNGQISNLPPELQAYGTGAVAELASALGVTDGVAASSRSLEGAATGAVEGLPGEMAETGSGASSGLASGIGSRVAAVSSAASSVASAARGMTSVGDTYTSGLHLGQNFANGISRAKEAVRSAARAVADAAASALRFSVPREGPWSGGERGGETSGRHLGENFARGMERSVPDVERAALDLARAASFSELDARTSSSLSSARAAGAGAGGTSIGRVEVSVSVDARGLSGREAADVTATQFARALRRSVEGM